MAISAQNQINETNLPGNFELDAVDPAKFDRRVTVTNSGGTSATVQETALTTAGATEVIDYTTTTAEVKELSHISFNWVAGAAPSTNEDITITIVRDAGAEYNTLLYQLDPATHSIKDLVITFESKEIVLGAADQLQVEYLNTDDLGIGVTINFV